MTDQTASAGTPALPLESRVQILEGRLTSLESQLYSFMGSTNARPAGAAAPAAVADVAAAPQSPHHDASEAGIDLIVTEEDSGQAYYTKHYVHFEWPEGASGPTAGIGYDCGYSTADHIRKDWTGIVDDATVEALVKAADLKGQAAAEFVREHYATINWDQAMAEFDNREFTETGSRVSRRVAEL
jgi:hypothetical protein